MSKNNFKLLLSVFYCLVLTNAASGGTDWPLRDSLFGDYTEGINHESDSKWASTFKNLFGDEYEDWRAQNQTTDTGDLLMPDLKRPKDTLPLDEDIPAEAPAQKPMGTADTPAAEPPIRQNYDEARDEYEFSKYDSELKEIQETIASMRQEATAMTEKQQEAAHAAEKLALISQRHTDELERVRMLLRDAEERAELERHQTQKLFARLDQLDLRQASLTEQAAQNDQSIQEQRNQNRPETTYVPESVQAPVLRLSDAEAKLVDDHRQKQVEQLTEAAYELQRKLEESKRHLRSKLEENERDISATREENARLTAELDLAVTDKNAHEQEAASAKEQLSASVHRIEELARTTNKQDADLTQVRSEQQAFRERWVKLKATAQSQRQEAQQATRNLELQLRESQRTQAAFTESQERLAEAQQEAQARRNGMTEAKKQMQLLIEENTLLRAQHEQIQRALASPTRAAETKPVLIRQKARFPQAEESEKLNRPAGPPQPTVTELPPLSAAAPLNDSTATPHVNEQTEEELTADEAAPIEEDRFDAVEENISTASMGQADQPAEDSVEDSMIIEPEVEPEVDEPISNTAEKATETTAATAEIHEVTVAPPTMSHAPSDKEPTPEQPRVHQTTSENADDTSPRKTPQAPPKLGAAFGPQGSPARTYFIMFLQATLAILTIGILTGGCKITVQHGATDHLSRVASNYGGTRLALTL